MVLGYGSIKFQNISNKETTIIGGILIATYIMHSLYFVTLDAPGVNKLIRVLIVGIDGSILYFIMVFCKQNIELLNKNLVFIKDQL